MSEKTTPAPEALPQPTPKTTTAPAGKRHEYDLRVDESVIALKSDTKQTIKIPTSNWKNLYEKSGLWDLVDSGTADQKKSS